MPDERNGRITLALLGSKLDTIREHQKDMQEMLERMREAAGDRDKKLTALETQMEDVTWWKRAILGLILGFVVNAGGVIYAIVQHYQN